jgi:hypothetical protein
MSDEHALIARYMKDFERALEIHDVSDRRDIAVELKGHIDEALASGKSLGATLESLGPADTLARAYAIELHMNRRKGTGLAMRLFKVGSILAASSCMTLFVTTTLGLLSLAFVLGGALGLVELMVDIPHVEVTGPPGVMTPLVSTAILLIILVAGAALGWVFWLYLRFIHRTLRKSLPRAWAAQPA